RKDSLLRDELSASSKNLQKAYERGNKEQIEIEKQTVMQAKNNFAAHIEMLRKQYSFFASTRYPQPMGLHETALRDDEWVISYHVTDPGLIIYLTRGKHLRSEEHTSELQS